MASILFLDDCPDRCERFAALEPDAVIVHTAADCIWHLAGGFWDEVHLDHDLGGDAYMDPESELSGMEVVRWILLNRPDVLTFVVHSWNSVCGLRMHMALRDSGYRSLRIPFRFT